MGDEVKRRPYSSPARRAQAEAARAAILDAAAGLFVARGYLGTSTRAIAERAGVSEASVFANFGSKARVLAHVIAERVAQDPDFPLSGNAALTARTPRSDAAAAFARIARRAHERSWRLLTVAAAAASDDPDLAAAMRRGAERRLHDIRWLVTEILSAPSPETTADGIWAVASVDVYRQLVVDRHWPARQYEAWLARMILASLEDGSSA